MWLSWIDDCVVGRCGQDPMNKKRKMKQLFECDDSGELVEYIGNKVQMDQNKGLVQLTQPVLIQSFKDEFGA